MSNSSFCLDLFSSWISGNDPVFELFCKGKKVLDLGCGEGDFIKKDPQNIYGVDINEVAIQRCRTKGLNVKLGKVTEIPYEEATFDVVLVRNVIEHLTPVDARLMLIEMKRVLRSGGSVVLITPMPKTVWNTFGHLKPYPPIAIKKIFRDRSLEGFESVKGMAIENIFYYGGWSSNKLLFAFSTFLAQFINFFRGAYLMIIRKNDNE